MPKSTPDVGVTVIAEADIVRAPLCPLWHVMSEAGRDRMVEPDAVYGVLAEPRDLAFLPRIGGGG